jgi:hypothetical protein
MDAIGYDAKAGVVTPGASPTSIVVGSNSGTQFEPVPEPASLAVLGAALMWLGLSRPRPPMSRNREQA